MNSHRLRVLIIDDNAEWASQVRRVIERRLPDGSREVKWASTMAGARELSASFQPHITLLDLDLPDSSPDETIESIKHFIPPVFVLSAFANRDARSDDLLWMKCAEAGAERVYTKDVISVMTLVSDIVFVHMKRTFQIKRERHGDELAKFI